MVKHSTMLAFVFYLLVSLCVLAPFPIAAQELAERNDTNEAALIDEYYELWESEKYQAALDVAAHVFRLRQDRLGPDSALTADALLLMSWANAARDRFSEAILLELRAINIFETNYGADSEQVVSSLMSVANSFSELKKFDHYRGFLKRAADAAMSGGLVNEEYRAREQAAFSHSRKAKNLYGKWWNSKSRTNPPEVWARFAALGAMQSHDKVAVAQRLRLLDLAITHTGIEGEFTEDARHNWDVARTQPAWRNLEYADAFKEKGNSERELELRLLALARFNAMLGPYHPISLSVLGQLPGSYFAQGRLDDAVAAQREFLQRSQDLHGSNSEKTLIAVENLAFFLDEAGQISEAIPMYQRAFELSKQVLGPNHDQTRKNLVSIVKALTSAGRDAETVSFLRELLALQEAQDGLNDDETLFTMTRLADTLAELGDLAEAAEVNRILAQRLEVKHGLKELKTLFAWHNLAVNLSDLGRLEEAEAIHQRLYRTKLAVFGHEHIETLVTRSSLALIVASRGQLQQAEELQRALVEQSVQLFGADNETTLSFRNNHIQTLSLLGRTQEAASMQREVLEVLRHTLGPDDDQTLAGMSNLAVHYEIIGQSDAAAKLLREVYEARTEQLGLNHLTTLKVLSSLGSAEQSLGNLSLAEEHMRTASVRLEEKYGLDHPQTLLTLNNLAIVIGSLGRVEEAEDLHRKVLSARQRVLGPDHPHTIGSMANLATTLMELGRPDKAEPILRQALAAFERTLGPDHPSTLLVTSDLAGILGNLGRIEEALSLRKGVHLRAEGTLGPSHPQSLTARRNLAVSLLRAHDHVAAEAVLADAVELFRTAYGPDHSKYFDILNIYAGLRNQQGDFEDAAAMRREAVDGLQRTLGSAHPKTLDAQASLALSLQGQEAFAEALELQRLVYSEAEKALGQAHPQTITSLHNLTLSLVSEGNLEEALPLARRYWRLQLGNIARFSSASDTQRAQLMEESAAAARVLIAVSSLLSRQDPTREVALMSEAFEASQSTISPAASALTRSAARISTRAEGLAQDFADLEAAKTARDRLDQRMAATFANDQNLPPEALSQARGEIASLRKKAVDRIASIEELFRSKHSNFFDLVSPRPLSIAELQGRFPGDVQSAPLLSENEVLIQFALDDSAVGGVVWAVTRERFAWASIGLGQEALVQGVADLHAQLGGGNRSAVPLNQPRSLTASFDRQLAFQLYEALFGAPQIRELLEGKSDWLISPDGVLFSMPFAVLVSEEPQGADNDPDALRATSWLGLERYVSIVPSVGTIRTQRRLDESKQTTTAAFFGIGDPNFRGEPERVQTLPNAAQFFRSGVGDTSAIRALPRLPGTRREIKEMAQALGAGEADYLLGQAANETLLTALSDAGTLGEKRVVLFATHGLMAGAFPGLEEPALALSPPEKLANAIGTRPGEIAGAERIDDGLLTASEAALLNLNADWVILSACDTAAGDKNSPDAVGLSGLARAFFFAGARSLLVTHWPVNDSVAARLTTEAVQSFESGAAKTRAQALQIAMRSIVNDRASDKFAHPSVWAPFQVVGVDRIEE